MQGFKSHGDLVQLWIKVCIKDQNEAHRIRDRMTISDFKTNIYEHNGVCHFTLEMHSMQLFYITFVSFE